jgi:hypothetical protein
LVGSLTPQGVASSAVSSRIGVGRSLSIAVLGGGGEFAWAGGNVALLLPVHGKRGWLAGLTVYNNCRTIGGSCIPCVASALEYTL